MNRRKVLKAFLAAPFVAAGGSAVAVERPGGLTMAPTTPNEMTFDSEPEFFCEGSGELRKYEGGIDYENKYWEAQAHINELYAERPHCVSYTVEGLTDEDRVVAIAQPKR